MLVTSRLLCAKHQSLFTYFRTQTIILLFLHLDREINNNNNNNYYNNDERQTTIFRFAAFFYAQAYERVRDRRLDIATVEYKFNNNLPYTSHLW